MSLKHSLCSGYYDQRDQFFLKTYFLYKQLGAGFSPESCCGLKLMVAQQFDQVTYVCKEYNNLQDSKLIFIMTNFTIFPTILLRQLNLGVIGLTTIVHILQKKNSAFLYLQFLLLLSERGLSPKSCLVNCPPRAICL